MLWVWLWDAIFYIYPMVVLVHIQKLIVMAVNAYDFTLFFHGVYNNYACTMYTISHLHSCVHVTLLDTQHINQLFISDWTNLLTKITCMIHESLPKGAHTHTHTAD